MLTAFIRAFRTPDLRKKLLFTLGIVALFRFGSTLPAPGIDQSNVSHCAGVAAQSGLASTLQIVDLLSGNALKYCRCSRSASCRASPRASFFSC